MNSIRITHPKTVDPDFTLAVTMAQLVERLEQSAVPVDPAQYRLVARKLADAIAALPPGAPLQSLLHASRAATEVYENLNYQHAGLCRAPLEASLDAELRTRDALARAASGTAAHGAG